MSKDQAARIANKFWPKCGGYIGEASDHRSDDLARSIRRAITSAVRKERERCVGIVQKECNTDIAWVGRTTVCKSIIKAINGGKRGKA